VKISAVLLFAEEGHEAATGFLGVPTLVWQIANLASFLLLLWYLLRKPVAEFFGNRRADVAKALAKADDDRRRAETLAAELAQRLAQIETELTNLRETARKDAEAEHAALLKQTDDDAARFLARASIDVDNRVRAARAELTAYAGDLAVEVAREMLAKNVTAEDDKRLMAAGIAELSAQAKGREGQRG
jgi:F-type H+-transporting ATPase subunit b